MASCKARLLCPVTVPSRVSGGASEGRYRPVLPCATRFANPATLGERSMTSSRTMRVGRYADETESGDRRLSDVTTHEFDVVVLGAGPAGETAAGRAADNGLSVAVVEPALVGGECSYWGCIPSKTLLRPGDVVAAARRVPGAAAAVTGSIDARAVFARRDYMVSDYDDKGQLPWLSENNIDLVRGHGRLAGDRRVEVTQADGTVRRLTAGRAGVIATGTAPFVPPVPGLAEAAPWDNRTATGAKDVPARLLVLGGGA